MGESPMASGGDRGAVTVEAAMGIASLVVVFGLVLAAAAAVLVQLRCTDAAVEAARLLARGDDARATAAVRALGPASASLTVARRADQVIVTVGATPLDLPLPELTARAVAMREPLATADEFPARSGNARFGEEAR